MALANYGPELARFAGASLRAVILESGKLSQDVEAFVADVATHLAHRIKNVFIDRHLPVRATLCHDIPAFEKAARPQTLSQFAYPEPIEYRYILDSAQEEFIARQLRLYGESLTGISRIMTRHYAVKLFRHAIPAHLQHAELTSRVSEFEIAGLQESMN